jgi:hypothetical protein
MGEKEISEFLTYLAVEETVRGLTWARIVIATLS